MFLLVLVYSRKADFSSAENKCERVVRGTGLITKLDNKVLAFKRYAAFIRECKDAFQGRSIPSN